MSSRSIQIGVLGAVALCLLRLGIGWHFFKEGAKKFQGTDFTAQYFLEQSTGPWSDYFQSWIPDRYGLERLDLTQTLTRWDTFVQRMVDHFGLDQKQAQRVAGQHRAQLQEFHEHNREYLDEYRLEMGRYLAARQENIRDVHFQKTRLTQRSAELKGKLAPWLATLKRIDRRFEDALYALAGEGVTRRPYTLEQSAYLPVLNAGVKYVVIVVGILLMLGLLTRSAAIVGMVFLASVMATQPPWVEGAQLMHFYYQFVEVLALAVLAACGAGHFGGLDYIVRSALNRRRVAANLEHSANESDTRRN